MKIIIVGDGKVGATLTEHLSKEGHNVVVIDQDSQVVEEMVNRFDVMGISGNGASCSVLLEAGANKADLLIAATSSDELNILSCMVSKKIGTRHTIARVRNPEYSQQLSFLREELGLSMAVNPEMETATEICRTLRFPSAINIETFARGRVELAEIKVKPGSILDGVHLYSLPDRIRVKILVCAVQRGTRSSSPTGTSSSKPATRSMSPPLIRSWRLSSRSSAFIKPRPAASSSSAEGRSPTIWRPSFWTPGCR